jgi:hypothetical protein
MVEGASRGWTRIACKRGGRRLRSRRAALGDQAQGRVRRPAVAVLALVLLAVALVAGFIGGGDVLTAVTGDDQDSPSWVLVTVGGVFLLAGAGLAMLALAALGASAAVHAGALAAIVPLLAVPWWDALGPAGGLVNAVLLLAAVALARRLAAPSH